MSFNYSPKIVTDGLTFYVDAANPKSYVSGSTTTDSLVSDITGTLINDTDFSTDNQGSWVFDGTDDYIDFGDILSFGTENYALEAWCKTTTTNTNYMTVIAKFSGVRGPWMMLRASTRVAMFGWTTTNNADGTTSLADGIWHHLVGQRTGLTTAEIYVDGVLEGTSSNGSGTADQITSLRIGDMDYPAREFNGNISNCKIYNRALSSDEVLQNYNALKGRFGL